MVLQDFITRDYFMVFEQRELLEFLKNNIQPDQSVIDIIMEIERISSLIPLGENRGFSTDDKISIVLRRLAHSAALQTAIVLRQKAYAGNWEKFQAVAVAEDKRI